MEKKRSPRKPTRTAPLVLRNPDIIPIWTFAQNDPVPRVVELPASFREAFIARYKGAWTPDWQELTFWISIRQKLQEYRI